ncbi:MAG: glycosyltransferase [Armatimonadetes bacterium]|nr:glycosyltransferase [Armatimonadota bacterium]
MSLGSGPLVSVVVPCYNRGKLIWDTINSLLRQTLDDWECIIVNDGSTDDTEQVLQDISAQDSRIRFINQANKGPAGARNRGLDEVRGKYIQLLDSDDVIAPHKLDSQVSLLRKVDDLAVVYCDFEFQDQDGNRVIPSWTWRVRIDETDPLADVALNWQHEIIIPPCCFLFDARFFTQHHIREDESIRANEDYDLLLKVFALKPRLFFQDEVMAAYRVTPGSVSKDHARLRRTYFHIIDNHLKLFSGDERMKDILLRKKRLVKRDFWQYAPPYEIGWWLFRARCAAKKLLPQSLYERAKRVFIRG